MLKSIDNYFGITRLGSTFRIEILAGISTFLSLSYIFVVNPAILSACGMDTSAVFFATVMGSVIATLLMGLWARLPFAVAPGLEMNAYVAYVVAGTMAFSWQGAMGAVFWSGVLTVALSYTPLRINIINAIPDKLKSGLAAAVGVFLMLVALKVSNILVYEGIQVSGIGSISSKEAIIFFAGLIFVFTLKHFNIKGAVLISIIGAAIIAHILGIGKSIKPIELSSKMFSATFALDLQIIFNPKIWTVILVLFILDFYGSIAKFIGLTRNTSLVDKDGNLPRIKEGLVVDGLGTVIGGITGTSNLITYVESAIGIGEGGRTGLVAIIIALLMSLFLFLVPLINLVPASATTGAVFFVGLMLLPNKEDLKSYTWADKIAVAIMILVTVWTFGLDKAMFAGFAAYSVLLLVRCEWRQLNAYLLGSTIILFVSIMLSKS
jgi:AGZA family xanthine/uracil permease-like MFS transporter